MKNQKADRDSATRFSALPDESVIECNYYIALNQNVCRNVCV